MPREKWNRSSSTPEMVHLDYNNGFSTRTAFIEPAPPARFSRKARSHSLASSNPCGGWAVSDTSETPLWRDRERDTFSTVEISMGRRRLERETSMDGWDKFSANLVGDSILTTKWKNYVLTQMVQRLDLERSFAESLCSDSDSLPSPTAYTPNTPISPTDDSSHFANRSTANTPTPTTPSHHLPLSPLSPTALTNPPSPLPGFLAQPQVDPNYIFVSSSGIMQPGPIFRVPSYSDIPGEPVGSQRDSVIPDAPFEHRRTVSELLQAIGKRASFNNGADGRRIRMSSMTDAHNLPGGRDGTTDPFQPRIHTVLSAPNIPNLSRMSAQEIREAMAVLQGVEARPVAAVHEDRSSHSSVVVGRNRGRRSPVSDAVGTRTSEETGTGTGTYTTGTDTSGRTGSGSGTTGSSTASDEALPPPRPAYLSRRSPSPVAHRFPGRPGLGHVRTRGMFADQKSEDEEDAADEGLCAGVGAVTRRWDKSVCEENGRGSPTAIRGRAGPVQGYDSMDRGGDAFGDL
ncbi:hypothetical protein HK101_000757 [Irineochytrium annulatum]|nr:hypothetical protein HK101_000757 [Irineochytrium annulatum]